MSVLTQIHDNYETLNTDTDKINLFKSTALDEEPTVTELNTIGKFKVLIYKEG